MLTVKMERPQRRFRRPLIRDGDDLVETDWDTAMRAIVAGTACRSGRMGTFRLLHHQPALPREVLHARRHRVTALQSAVVQPPEATSEVFGSSCECWFRPARRAEKIEERVPFVVRTHLVPAGSSKTTEVSLQWT